jgi:hypothetical protein
VGIVDIIGEINQKQKRVEENLLRKLKKEKLKRVEENLLGELNDLS